MFFELEWLQLWIILCYFGEIHSVSLWLTGRLASIPFSRATFNTSFTVDFYVQTPIRYNNDTRMPIMHSPLNSTQGWIFLGVNPGAKYAYFTIEEPNNKKSLLELTAPLSLDDSIWHSISGSVDRQRNEMRLYVDGILGNSTINPGLVHNPSLVIGTQGYVWPALVSRLTVWTYARPESQLRYSYHTCTIELTSNQLLGFFPFEIGYEGGRSILKDDSLGKSKNPGTLAGSLSLETVGPCVSATRTPTLTEEKTEIIRMPREQLSPTKLLILLALVLTLPVCGGVALAIGIYKYRRKRGTSGPPGEFSGSLNRSSTPSDTSNNLHIRIMDVVLGTGSFGRVMQGVNLRNGELVAVKQMISYLNSIAKEVEMLTILDHPNVVKYLGCFTDEPGNTYLVVEFCAGGSLHSMLNRVGSFSIGMVHHYLKDALLGLQYLHSNHVVHRDIKPGNLLLTTQGVCKIADFGTARLAPAGWLQDTATGTVCYMCPEAIRGEILPAVDIWAIGVTTCELLSGHRPWSHTNMTNQATLGNYIAHFDSIYPIPDWLPAEVKDFITQCLSIDPSHRPTCKDLLLHPFLKRVEFRDSTTCGPHLEGQKDNHFGTQSFDL